eukprot:UN22488
MISRNSDSDPEEPSSPSFTIGPFTMSRSCSVVSVTEDLEFNPFKKIRTQPSDGVFEAGVMATGKSAQSPKSGGSRSHDEEFGRQVSRPIVFDDKLLAGGVDRSSKFSNRKRVSFRQNLEDVHMMSRSESLGTPLVSMEIDEQLIKASEQAQSNAHSASDMSSGYLEPEVNNLEVFEKHLKNNKLKKQLERLPSWNFDIFAIYNECQNFTLPVLCLSIFHDLEIEKN